MCTPCAWERGWYEVRVVVPGGGPYGPYAGAVREAVASCADYLGRIGRVLRRGGDREYVACKAIELRDAAGRLVGLCHDVEGWLKACGARTEHSDGEEHWSEECALESGHAGGHDAHPPRTALEVSRDAAGEMARVCVELADRLRWLVEDPRRVGPGELEGLGRRQARLGRMGEDLSVALAGLRLGAGHRGGSPPLLDAGGCEEELVCWDCEFVAASVEDLARHQREGCRCR